MDVIQYQLKQLDKLVEQYPVKLPLSEVAKFLDMNEEGLKAALMRGNAPFGFAYQKGDGAYRVNVIPTVKFYLWFTNTNGRMVMSEEIRGNLC